MFGIVLLHQSADRFHLNLAGSLTNDFAIKTCSVCDLLVIPFLKLKNHACIKSGQNRVTLKKVAVAIENTVFKNIFKAHLNQIRYVFKTHIYYRDD